MLDNMNVWSFEKSYKDKTYDTKNFDERKQQEDKQQEATELSLLTGSTDEISNNQNDHVEISSSALENGGK